MLFSKRLKRLQPAGEDRNVMSGHHQTQTTHVHPAHPPPHHASTAPRITLSFTPPGPEFFISETADMPVIKATAKLENVTLAANQAVEFVWSAAVHYEGLHCAHSMGRHTNHKAMHARTPTGEWTIPFTQTRGGTLTVTVQVHVNHLKLSATGHKLSIGGTNPSATTLITVSYPNETFKKLMRLESGLQQFRTAGGAATSHCPLFSGDNKGGVGICQVTDPAPSDEEVWSWKENVKAGIRFWKAKESGAKSFVVHQQNGQHFKDLVKRFNQQRHQHGQPPITITLPDFTDDQLEKDTLRGFNGYAGGWHEYRIATDAHGHLVVTIDPGGTTGTAEWHRNTAAERRAHYQAINLDTKNWGDPNYVDDVLSQASF